MYLMNKTGGMKEGGVLMAAQMLCFVRRPSAYFLHNIKHDLILIFFLSFICLCCFKAPSGSSFCFACFFLSACVFVRVLLIELEHNEMTRFSNLLQMQDFQLGRFEKLLQ